MTLVMYSMFAFIIALSNNMFAFMGLRTIIIRLIRMIIIRMIIITITIIHNKDNNSNNNNQAAVEECIGNFLVFLKSFYMVALVGFRLKG